MPPAFHKWPSSVLLHSLPSLLPVIPADVQEGCMNVVVEGVEKSFMWEPLEMLTTAKHIEFMLWCISPHWDCPRLMLHQERMCNIMPSFIAFCMHVMQLANDMLKTSTRDENVMSHTHRRQNSSVMKPGQPGQRPHATRAVW